MNILIIGREYKHQQCYRFMKALDQKSQITYKFMNIAKSIRCTNEQMVYRDVIEIEVKEKYDFVLVFQSKIVIRIKTHNTVVYWDTEFTWYPSCMGADYILFIHPEREDLFYKHYPQFLKGVKDTLLLPCILPENEERFEEIEGRERQRGLYFIGSLTTADLSSYYQRTVYYDRMKVCADLEHAGLLSVMPPSYGPANNYCKKMKKWEFGLAVDGRGSYFSPRPIEYCKEGVFPIIYVGSDIRAMNYYEDIGFEHCVNCYFYDGDVKSLFAFMTGVTRLESTRNIMNVLELFKERFTLKANINKIREFLDIDQIR